VPDELPDHVAVLTEIMSVTHGVENGTEPASASSAAAASARPSPAGSRPLGLCHLIKAKLLGAGKLIATDPLPPRLKMAEGFGASLTRTVDDTEPAERIAPRPRNSWRHSAPISCWIAAASPRPSSRRSADGAGRRVVVEPGPSVDMGPVGINPNSDICTKNVSVIGVGGETATAYLPSMRLMAATSTRLPLDRIVSTACRWSAPRRGSSWRKPTRHEGRDGAERRGGLRAAEAGIPAGIISIVTGRLPRDIGCSGSLAIILRRPVASGR